MVSVVWACLPFGLAGACGPGRPGAHLHVCVS